ncbi:MAG: tetratricopeptide repeat protein [Deltaproteobacteria bacterium]|nr:tetratricopeptide repeat protein [Deltaproteobacteria bacterium]
MTAEAPPAAAPETRKLAAIMFTDIVGFSRQMGSDEARTLRLLEAHNQAIRQAVAAYHGQVIKTVGDAFLVDFPSVVHAVQCAQRIQTQFRAHNAETEKAEQIHVRIGIHLGDIVQKDGDVFGDGVNIAARLQALAAPDTICISDMVYRDVAQKVELGTVVSLGRPRLKNIAQRFLVYALLSEKPKGIRQILRVQRLKLSRRVYLVVLVFVLVSVIFGGIATVRYFSPPIPSTQPPTPSTQAAPAALPLPDKPSIAVLPFTNMSGDPEQEYFSDGMTEDLITALSKLSGLFVIARHSAFVYKGRAVKVTEVSQELGVRYVLEGSVRKADSQVRINAQLVDATTGHHLWAESYDRELKDIFALQDEIREKIVFALKVKLTPEEQARFRYFPTASLEAYDALSRGREYFFRISKEANTQARQLFERAIELDPQYAAAYAVLAWTSLAEFLLWNQDPQTLERAFATAQRAVALDDSLPVAHMTLGDIYLWRKQPEQALAEAERAITLDPNFSEGYAHLGNILNATGRPAEALKMVEQALRLSPHPPFYYLSWLGESHLRMGHYEEAIAAQKQVLLRNPNFLPAHGQLAESYLAQWRSLQTQDPQTLERALESAQKTVALSDSLSWGHSLLAQVYLWKKQHEQALAEAEQTIALAPHDADSYASLAAVLSYAGQPEKAIEMMEQALRLNPHPPTWYFFDLGRAYRLTGRMEEAIATQKEVLAQDPNVPRAYGELAVLYSKLGREEEARAAASEYRRRNPKVSLEVLTQVLPYKDPVEVERMLAALRKAGLK